MPRDLRRTQFEVLVPGAVTIPDWLRLVRANDERGKSYSDSRQTGDRLLYKRELILMGHVGREQEIYKLSELQVGPIMRIKC